MKTLWVLCSHLLAVSSHDLSLRHVPGELLLCLFLKVKVKVKLLSHVRFFVTPWASAYQVPLSMGFSRQEYWSGFPFPSSGDLPDPGIEPSTI